MKEKLLEILNDINPEIDFASENAIIDDELIDSFDIVTLVGEINDEFDVNVTVVDLIPENFNSVDAMLDLINKLQNA